MDPDFQIIKRTSDQSGKYYASLKHQPNVNPENALVVSYADMQFKFSPAIYQKLLQKLGNPHFGYPNTKASFWKALSDWVTSRYYRQAVVDSSTTVLWNNTIASCHGSVEALTEPGDEVLIMCPTYYYFLNLVKYKQRKTVQFLFETKENRLQINFQKLEETLKANKIKLLIFCNPWNPCGRIWSKQQLGRLAQLVLKYKFYVLSDQIYADSVQPTQQQLKQGLTVRDIFTSMLVFEQIHKYLVFLCSYSKAFNSSGMALSYSICFDEEIHKKMNSYRGTSGGFPSSISYDLLEVIYTSKEARDWKFKTIKYIRKNYEKFKKLCAEKLPDLIIYDLESSYLCLVDFSNYQVSGKNLQDKFTKVDVCPTFMELSYFAQQDRPFIRLNLAINEKLIDQLVNRMQQMLKETQSEQK